MRYSIIYHLFYFFFSPLMLAIYINAMLMSESKKQELRFFAVEIMEVLFIIVYLPLSTGKCEFSRPSLNAGLSTSRTTR
jgi:hypothetical protein